MKQAANAPRRFLSATGGVVDLDALPRDQQRRKVLLEDEIARTEPRLTDVEQRLEHDGPPTYARIELAQTLVDTRNRYNLLKAELDHLNLQLEETSKRITAFDRNH